MSSRARTRPAWSTTASTESSHSCVSAGSGSAGWDRNRAVARSRSSSVVMRGALLSTSVVRLGCPPPCRRRLESGAAALRSLWRAGIVHTGMSSGRARSRSTDNRVAARGAAPVAALPDPAQGRVDVAERRPGGCSQRHVDLAPARRRSPASGRDSSSCCSWWTRKLRCAISAERGGCEELAHVSASTAARGSPAHCRAGSSRDPRWSEEPAPDPPRLRKRGRGSGDRVVAVDEAVMGSLHRLWDRAWVASVGLRSPLCRVEAGHDPGVGSVRSVVRSLPTHRQTGGGAIGSGASAGPVSRVQASAHDGARELLRAGVGHEDPDAIGVSAVRGRKRRRWCRCRCVRHGR